MQTGKKRKLNDNELLCLCIKYYISEVKNISFIFVSIVFSIFFRISLKTLTKKIENKLNNNVDVRKPIIYMLGCSFLSSLISAINDYVIGYCSGKLQAGSSRKALYNILSCKKAGKLNLTSGKTQFVIAQGSKAISKIYKLVFFELITKISYGVGDCYIIYDLLGFKYLLLSFIVILIAYVIHFKGAVVLYNCRVRLNESRGECDKYIYENIINYETIKAYRAEDIQIDGYNDRITPWEDAYLYHIHTKIGLAFFHDVIFFLTPFLFAMLMTDEKDPAFSVKYVQMYGSIERLEKSAENISDIYIKYKESLTISNTFVYYLNEIEGFRPGSKSITSFEDSLRFIDVSYRSGDMDVFDGLYLDLKKTEKMVIYGRNGSGKSTMFRLILRLLEPSRGEILLDGHSISSYKTNDYRRLISYVPQETYLFDDTIFNNLIYGNNKSYVDVISMCKLLDIHDDILRLGEGYNYVVGERGKNINGGLRQKIFYARSFLMEAEIYLFDEPTNNLDESSSIGLINILLGDMFKDKTILVICHDYEMVLKFPKILKFKEGKLEHFIK